MSSSSNVLREYLVSLGYSVDNVSQKKFDLALLNSDRSASGLARTLLGVAASAQAMMLVYARSMERLYYSSMKAESSVGSLQAISFAARNIGLSGDAMVAGVEGMARAMRSNPGLKALLTGQFGINTQGKETTALLVEFVEKLSTMPDYIATSFAQMFGIDPDTYFLLSRQVGQFKEVMALRKQWASEVGLDAEQGAQALHDYANETREIEERFKVLAQVVAIQLLPAFRSLTHQVSEALKSLTQLLGSGGFSWDSIKGVVKEVSKDWARLQPKNAEERSSLWDRLLEGLGIKDVGGGVKLAARPGDVRQPLGLRQHNPGNLRRWGNAAVVNGFAQFGTDAEGLSAMAGNLLSYAANGFNTIRSIIGRWAPSSENNTAGYIKAITGAMGIGADTLLNLRDPQVLQALMAAMIKQEQGHNPFSAEMLNAAVQSRLGQTTINQKIDIRVDGAGSPEATARAVGREQTRVNGDLVRNLGRGPQ